ncbi:TPA: fimbrial protein [Klebsiella aerogenes]|uniref:fimbrial protein n=1 Tax=Klebsiella aerogenes TaxID=548 RepID=UPI00196889D0|nr:fimbrial protein [Klebsiella aerogenes]ELA1889548.1 type 1 fimbrial protein [Klebsiella aerogenes]MDF0550360.1 fimbrial protein [Klebsiella aerogenes]QSB60650.1 type 1 fimbrial protein [Klebsiella aerogenes]
MKMKNVAVACALMAGMTFTASSAFAAKNAEPTNGKIHFTGSLVNSACGLAPESSPVQVNFGEIPTSQLKDNQRAGVKHAKIVLQGCDTTVAKTATVTYTPATIDADNNALAAFTSGTAKGAGIGMVDSGNQDVEWGKAASQVNITDGETDIDFVAYLQANNASAAVTPGDFESTVNFQIDYQ